MHFLRVQFSVPYSFKFKKHLEVSFHFYLFHLFLNKIPQKLSSKLPVLKVFHPKKKKKASQIWMEMLLICLLQHKIIRPVQTSYLQEQFSRRWIYAQIWIKFTAYYLKKIQN